MPASPEPAAASPVAAPVDPVKSEDTKDTAKETATVSFQLTAGRRMTSWVGGWVRLAAARAHDPSKRACVPRFVMLALLTCVASC